MKKNAFFCEFGSFDKILAGQSWSNCSKGDYANSRNIPIIWQMGDFSFMCSVWRNPEGFKPIILNGLNL